MTWQTWLDDRLSETNNLLQSQRDKKQDLQSQIQAVNAQIDELVTRKQNIQAAKAAIP